MARAKQDPFQCIFLCSLLITVVIIGAVSSNLEDFYSFPMICVIGALILILGVGVPSYLSVKLGSNSKYSRMSDSSPIQKFLPLLVCIRCGSDENLQLFYKKKSFSKQTGYGIRTQYYQKTYYKVGVPTCENCYKTFKQMAFLKDYGVLLYIIVYFIAMIALLIANQIILTGVFFEPIFAVILVSLMEEPILA